MPVRPFIDVPQAIRDWTRWCRDTEVSVKAYTVANLPDATKNAWLIVGVSNESGGTVLAFSDSLVWRRCTDRAVVS